MSDDLRRRLDAQSIQLQRMQQQMQAQQARVQEEVEEEIETTDPRFQYNQQFQQPQNQHQQYNQVDPTQIAMEAARLTAQQLQNNQEMETGIKKRMERLISEYPEVQEEDSPLTVKARDVYQRVAKENPGLDQATMYELSVREAASVLGRRPINAPIEDVMQDFVMPSNQSTSRSGGKKSKSRLTPSIVTFAHLLGVNVDPQSAEGKNNLAELSQNSERFNADVDESQYKYR